ncbi:LOW QUALITY PROTEIN: hypothetical protein Ct61P_12346 [Colletotrichum tofieldiae]|nr:LOW QUALITY PROTEIN: hypothetical protein Ct61P_12346 [Colletotrichum tofieldiae]
MTVVWLQQMILRASYCSLKTLAGPLSPLAMCGWCAASGTTAFCAPCTGTGVACVCTGAPGCVGCAGCAVWPWPWMCKCPCTWGAADGGAAMPPAAAAFWRLLGLPSEWALAGPPAGPAAIGPSDGSAGGVMVGASRLAPSPRDWLICASNNAAFSTPRRSSRMREFGSRPMAAWMASRSWVGPWGTTVSMRCRKVGAASDGTAAPVAVLVDPVAEPRAAREVMSCLRGCAGLGLGCGGGIFLAQMLRVLPDTLLVAAPDDDALVVRAGHDASVLAAAAAGGQSSAVRRDILRSATARVAGLAPAAPAVLGKGGDDPVLDGLEVLLVNPLRLGPVLVGAVREIAEAGLDGPDEVGMRSQTGHLETRSPVKDLDLVVAAATNNPPTVVLHAGNALAMANDGADAHLLGPVPDLDVSVAAGRDHLVVADLHGVHGGAVPVQDTDHCAGRGGEDDVDIAVPRLSVLQGSAVEDLDGFVLGAGDQDPLVELDVENRLGVCVLEALDDLSRREAPEDDVRVAAAGDDEVFLRGRIELQAQDGAGVPLERLPQQPAGVHAPDANRLVSAAADEVVAVVLQAVDALLVAFLEVIGVRQLEVGVLAELPVLLETAAHRVELRRYLELGASQDQSVERATPPGASAGIMGGSDSSLTSAARSMGDALPLPLGSMPKLLSPLRLLDPEAERSTSMSPGCGVAEPRPKPVKDEAGLPKMLLPRTELVEFIESSLGTAAPASVISRSLSSDMARFLYVCPSSDERTLWRELADWFRPSLTFRSQSWISEYRAFQPSMWYSFSQSLRSRANSCQARQALATLMRDMGSR